MVSIERLHDFIREAEKLPFAAKENLEVSVGGCLQKAGFKMQRNPNGERGHPDWRVHDDAGMMDVECKSTETRSSYHFSYTPPKPNVLYVFSSLTYNNTVCRFGNQIFPIGLEALVIETLTKLSILNNVTKLLFKNHPLNRHRIYPETQATWKNAAGININATSYFDVDAPVFKAKGFTGFFKKCAV